MSRLATSSLTTMGTVNGIGLFALSLTASTDAEFFDAQMPDPTWTFTDGAGHFHAYDSAGKLPTLGRVVTHLDCDGTCGGVCDGEGYSKIEYQCPLCDEYVKPRTVRGQRHVSGPTIYTAQASGPRDLMDLHEQVVSFTCEAGYFGSGTLIVTGVTSSSTHDEVHIEVVLREAHERYGTRAQRMRREPRANLTQAILAGAKAVRGPWESLPEESRAEFLHDFATLAAARAITAALPLLGLDENGEVLP